MATRYLHEMYEHCFEISKSKGNKFWSLVLYLVSYCKFWIFKLDHDCILMIFLLYIYDYIMVD